MTEFKLLKKFDPKWGALRWLNPEDYQTLCAEIINEEFEMIFDENIDEIKICASSMIDNKVLLELSKTALTIAHDIDVNEEAIENIKGKVSIEYIDILQDELSQFNEQLAHFINLLSSELATIPHISALNAVLEDTDSLSHRNKLNDYFDKRLKVSDLQQRKILKVKKSY